MKTTGILTGQEISQSSGSITCSRNEITEAQKGWIIDL